MAISITGTVTYSQNFDSLNNTPGSTTNTALPDGWEINETGTAARVNGQYAVDTGSSNSGDIYSYGLASAADRALGSLRSTTLTPVFGASFTNNTGATITSLTIGYTGEVWRIGTANRAAPFDKLDFQYSTNATSVSTGTWTDVDPLDFTTPGALYSAAGAKNGNDSANRVPISYTITGLNITAGSTFFIRWTDPAVASGANDGLAIDDFTLTAATSSTPSSETQTVAFATDSRTVSKAEGNSGTTSYTFTVERTGGTTGEVTFSGTVGAGGTTGADFVGGTVPTGFSGTIPAGATSAVVTIQVAGDLVIEGNEDFTLTLTGATNSVTTNVTTALATSGLTATATIANDDAVGTFAVSAPTFDEGDSGTTAGAFTITRTGGVSGSATISYVITADGTGGRIGSDDGLVVTGGSSGSVVFAEGETFKTINFTVTGDRTVEATETIPIVISTTTPGAVIGTASASATVTNDDVAGSVSIAGTTVNEGAGTVTLTVTRTGGGGDFAVDYATANGTALAGSDYIATSGTLTFTGGATTRTITVPIINDTVTESDEAFTVTLANPTAGAAITGGAATVTVFDNDTAAVTGSVSVASAQIVEGNSGTTALVVTLTRTGGTAAFTVDYATTDGGTPGNAAATAGSDYTATAGTATFGTGVNSVTVSIPILGDTVAELSEEFRLLLSNATNGATIGTGSAVLTITNDDTLPASTRIFTETFDGFTAAGFAPTPGAGQLNSNIWRVTGMSDAANPAYGFTGAGGSDFGRGLIANNETGGGVYSPTASPALVVQPTGSDFAPGSFIEARVQNVSGAAATAFDVAFDWAYRNNETRGEVLSFAWSTDGISFTTVSAAGITIPDAADTNGFVLAPRTASLTGLSVADQGYLYLRWTYVSTSGGGSRDEIGIDNVTVDRVGGSAVPTVSVSDVSVSEAAGTMTFTVTRTNVAAGAFSVAYATADGTATAGSDYTATSGTLNFAENQVSATVTVPITNDVRPEFDETLRLVLSNPSGANIVRATATGTITNDDGTPIQVAIGNASVLEGNDGTATLTFTVTRSGGTGAFDVGYATADGTATAGSDYVATSGTLSFAAGELTKTVSVTVNGDTLREPNETVSVVLSGATNDAIVTTATGTGTILNDEPTLISEIQGNSYFSPIVAGAGITGFGTGASTTVNATSFTVTVRAVVTAIDAVGNRQGFYITEEASDWDASDLTSEGIFVMTSTDTAGVGTGVMSAVPGLQVGQIVTVTANVMEYRPFNTNGPLTVLVNATVTLGASGQPLPILTLDAAHKIPNALLTGVAPDFTDSVDDPGDSFDATNYAMSFFETIEGMLVTVPDARVADGFISTQGGGTNFKVYSGVSANPEQINSRGGYTIAGDPALSPPDTASPNDNVIAGGKGVTDGDINPDILEIDFSDYAVAAPGYVTDGRLSMGDRLGDVTGIVEWNFTDMKLFPTALGTFTDTTLTKEVTTIAADPRALTFATFNVENLGGNADQARFDAIARVIAGSLGSPAILSIEEIQDNNGAATGGVTVNGVAYGAADATITWTRLVNAVNAATGKVYQWVDQAPVNGAEGGEPGGNIRVGFLYDTGRVQLGDLAADAPIEDRRKWVDRLGDNVRDAGDLIAVSDNMVSGINTADYTTTRLSLLGQFSFNGNTIFALANHLPSKGGSGTFWDASQINPQNGTPVNSDWTQRSNIGEDIYSLLNYAQTQVAGARILSGGDYNDFYFYRPLETATGYVYANGTARNDGAKLVNLALALPEAERYTYTFDGRSQAIDHILADAATAAAATTDVVHINSGFPSTNRISDHDPVVTSIDMRGFGEVLNGTSAGETINGFAGDDVIDGKGGADTLIGGLGNDVFYVDSLDDVVVENAGEGFDEVRTTLTNYVLPANVEKLTLIGAAGNSPLNLSGNAGNNVLTGGTSSDTINISQGGSDTVNAGDGDDGVFVGAALDAGDRIDGGAGTNDQVGLQGDYATQLVLGADTIRNVEMLVFLPGSDTRFGASGGQTYSYNIKSNDAMVAAGQQFVIQANTLRVGEALTFDGSAETDGSFLTYGGLGIDNLTGGAQNDGFYFGQDRFNATDRVDGGGGSMDQLGLQGDYSGAKAITFGAAQLTNIEMIVLLSGADARFGGGALRFSYTLTMDDGNVFGTAPMTIQANALRSDEVLILDASRETTAPYTVFGGAAGDTITGGAGADTLWGRGGADMLRGGGGNDVFAYFAASDSTAAARDTIADFARGDLIDVSRLGITRVVSGAFVADGTGQIRATSAGGNDWLIEGDADGNGATDLMILVTAGAGYSWGATDFRLASPPSSALAPFPTGDALALVA